MDLPPRWSLFDREGEGPVLVWTLLHGGWEMSVEYPVRNCSGEPSRVGMEPAEGLVSLGAPMALRAIPMRDIKTEAQALLLRAQGELGWLPELPELPKRCRSDADYLAWLEALTLLSGTGVKFPLKALVEHTGVSQATVSTRIAKARQIVEEFAA